MFSPLMVQVAVALLAVFSVGGVIVAALYPRLSGASRGEKRLEAIGASKRKAAAERIGAEEGRRRRSVEDTLKELEQAQKEKARRSQKPSLMTRIRQAGLSWSKRTYYVICVATAIVIMALFFVLVGFGPLPSIGFGLSAGVLLPHFFVNFKRKRRLRRFSNEFPNAVDVTGVTTLG
jgi:tight adherence protein B